MSSEPQSAQGVEAAETASGMRREDYRLIERRVNRIVFSCGFQPAIGSRNIE
jgi:hypothetical protein